jgi:hypothetical protein
VGQKGALQPAPLSVPLAVIVGVEGSTRMHEGTERRVLYGLLMMTCMLKLSFECGSIFQVVERLLTDMKV